MTGPPTEAEAQAEISDIDALVKEAKETLVKLEARRRQLVPTSQATERRVAATFHWATCTDSHYGNNGCGWLRDGVLADAWLKGTRSTWRNKGMSRLRASGEEPEAFIEALRTIASHEQLVKIDEGLQEIERIEREALEPEREEEAK